MTISPTTPIPAIPETPRDDIREILHGVEITDRYRWLEDGDAPAVRDWSDAQQRRTAAILDAVPGRDRLAVRLDALSRTGRVSEPALQGSRLFFKRRTGEMDQAALYVRDSIDGEERALIDPNADSDGLTTLDWWYPSDDGGLVVFGTSRGGDEWSTLQVVDVATGERRADRIERTRYSSIAWLPDGSGFYYTRLPRPRKRPGRRRELLLAGLLPRPWRRPVRRPARLRRGLPAGDHVQCPPLGRRPLADRRRGRGLGPLGRPCPRPPADRRSVGPGDGREGRALPRRRDPRRPAVPADQRRGAELPHRGWRSRHPRRQPRHRGLGGRGG